jgi:hypothetical protein
MVKVLEPPYCTRWDVAGEIVPPSPARGVMVNGTTA